MRRALLWTLAGALVLAAAPVLSGAQISDLSELDWREQALRFLSLRDASVRYALFGSLLLGLSCGLLGSFLVVRKLALVGDALSHAVLPGVAIGFLWAQTKDPVAIFVGATVAGLLGTVLVGLIRQTTPVKEDSALGLILAGFYGLGAVLFSMIQKQPLGDQAGLNAFLFGQASALSAEDIRLMAVITVLCVLLIVLFYKQLLAVSFDFGFAKAIGLPANLFHYLVLALLAFAVVIALQAVGVVLVSAMLITPAATAYLLTDRLHRMLLYAALFGMAAGVLGAFISFLGHNLPTGPFMVLAATVLFAAAFFLAPRHGWLPRRLRRQSQRQQIALENTLKAVYHVREESGFATDAVSLEALARRMNKPLPEAEAAAGKLVRQNLAELREPHDKALTGEYELLLQPVGWKRACEVVRNHRLWELYLTHEADYASDHVHEDAEVIEHVLGANAVRRLERLLDFPQRDPHGRLIPSTRDLEELGVATAVPGERHTGEPPRL